MSATAGDIACRVMRVQVAAACHPSPLRLMGRRPLIRLSATSDPESRTYGGYDPTAGQLSDAQRAFLERRKKASAGEEVELPSENACQDCGGAGRKQCPACNGTGINAEDKRADDDEVFVMSPNVSTNVFLKDCPCWLCRGETTVPCKECAGMGLVGAWDAWQYE